MVDEGHIITFAVHPDVAPPADRRAAAARLPRPRGRSRRARGDARGPAVEPARPPAVREVRLPAGRAAAALLQRQRRGRPDHDHRAAGRCRDARADRPPARRDRRGTRAPVAARPTPDDRPTVGAVSGGLVLADRIVVRRDGHRADRGRPAGSAPTSSPRRSRSTPRPAGSCPRSRPAPTCAGSCRSSTRRGPMRGATWDDIDAVAVTYGPGLAGSLLVGINFAKALAWVHDRPLVGVNHLEGHVYAAWLHDPSEDDRPDPVFPLVALVVSGGHTFLAEMRDHLTYRLLGSDARRRRRRGVRQGRPPARAGLSGRAGDRAGRRGGDAARPGLPARLARRFVRPELLRAQDRRPPDRHRGAGRRRPGRDARCAAPRRRRRRARLGVPGRRRGCAGDEDDPGGARRPAPARSCWAAGSRRTRALRATAGRRGRGARAAR